MNELANKKEVMSALYPYFKDNSSMTLLVGDMGFAVLDDYFDNHPERSFNVGIAEQGTMSMAAGMYLCGLRPIVYSQVPFLTMRAFEQIRYDICEHNMKIILVGVGANNYFEKLGRSHCMNDDDIKLMSMFNNLLILSPTKETIVAEIKKAILYDGPVYIRSV
jgi:transketolase